MGTVTVDQSCFASLIYTRTRTPPKPWIRGPVGDLLEGEGGEFMQDDRHSQQQHPGVPAHHHTCDLRSAPAGTSNQLNPSSRGGLSALGHAVDGLRLFRPRILSRTQGSHLSPRSPKQKVHGADVLLRSRTDTNQHLDHKPHTTSKTARWLQRCAAAAFHSRPRPRAVPKPCDEPFMKPAVLEPHYEPFTKPPILDSPLPGTCMKPPRIPDDLMSGAAARAAAATQNEILETVRNLRLVEPKVPRDSESGIGIEMLDPWDEDDDEVVRKDFFHILPEELLVQILSYLDATSLINVELVSRRWHRSASSNHIWRQMFCNEFDVCSPLDTNTPAQFQIGGRGLGRAGPGQDWKSMWRARKALNRRWKNAYAAAIYLDGHSDNVYCVQFDEQKILTGSRDRTIRIWDAHTYECIKVLGVPATGMSVSVPPLPADTAGRGQRPFKTVFPPEASHDPPATIPSLYHQGSILCLQYSDEILVTGSSDCTCIVWDIKDAYRPIRRLRHHTDGVLDVCFDRKYIVSCSRDTTICLWDQETGNFLRKLRGHREAVNAVQMRGNLVVSAGGDGVAKLWNLTSGLCIKEFSSKGRGMACVEFSPDSRTILAGGQDQVIYQFDTSTGELVRELNGHKNLVRSLHLDSANGRLVSGSYDTSVKVYDLATGENIVDFMGWTTSGILSTKADYRRIIATSQDSRIVIMDFGYELPGVELLEGDVPNEVNG